MLLLGTFLLLCELNYLLNGERIRRPNSASMEEGPASKEWTEGVDRDTYPGGVGGRNPFEDIGPFEVLMNTRPAPLPIVAVLLVAMFVWVPFIVSVVLLAVVLGIFASSGRAENYQIEQPLEPMNRFVSSIMYKREVPADGPVATS